MSYQEANFRALNFDLADLDLKIKKIKKLKDIKASDSMKLLKKELALYWKNNPKQSLIDTLSFKHVKSEMNKSITILNQNYKDYEKLLSYSYKYEYDVGKDEAKNGLVSYKKTLLKIETLEKYYNKLSKNPEDIISTKYKANYSLVNPIIGDIKQTFEKIYYTNASQTKFIKEETENDLNLSQLLNKLN